ncbi:MAG: NUDIX domain-containing protein [Alphaproteobacteria bacterium]|nr:MAG: NUDIX domain-containing protein [Alphaproteobacteria bacterium]
MSVPRFKLTPAVYLLLWDDHGDILLMLRQNTGYADGMYGLVAGHLDGDETATSAMCREAQEEAGIVLRPEDLYLRLTMHRLSHDSERIDLFFTTRAWRGQIVNAEPHKCARIGFFPSDPLPDTIIPYIREAILAIAQGRQYLEYGWRGDAPPNL